MDLIGSAIKIETPLDHSQTVPRLHMICWVVQVTWVIEFGDIIVDH